MKWKLYLDDLRRCPWLPKELNKDSSFLTRAFKDEAYTYVSRTMEEAMEQIHAFGFPIMMSLDHDLGPDQKTGHDFCKWLVECKPLFLRTGDDGMPEDITSTPITIHSANIVGAENMLHTLEYCFDNVSIINAYN